MGKKAPTLTEGSTMGGNGVVHCTKRKIRPIKPPPSPTRVKLKKICFECHTFDDNQRRSYKCAMRKTCPGLNWSKAKRGRVVKGRKFLGKHKDRRSTDGSHILYCIKCGEFAPHRRGCTK